MTSTHHPMARFAAALLWACCLAPAGAAPAAAAVARLPATLVATDASTPPALMAVGLRLQLLAARSLGGVGEFSREPGAKRLHFVVQRTVSAEHVGLALTRALRVESLSSNAPALVQLGLAFGSHRQFVAGDTLVFEQLPGQALRLFIKQAPAAEALGDARLMDVLVRAWVSGVGT